jgi:hypothetical protein
MARSLGQDANFHSIPASTRTIDPLSAVRPSGVVDVLVGSPLAPGIRDRSDQARTASMAAETGPRHYT